DDLEMEILVAGGLIVAGTGFDVFVCRVVEEDITETLEFFIRQTLCCQTAGKTFKHLPDHVEIDDLFHRGARNTNTHVRDAHEKTPPLKAAYGFAQRTAADT